MWSRSVGITLADSARLTTFMCHTLTYLLTPERSGVDKKQEIRSVELGVCPIIQCNFFIFDHVTFIQFKICCSVHPIFHWDMAIYRFSKWRPSAILELFYHHTRPPTKSMLLAAAAYQISCQSDTQIWIFRIFGLNCLFRPPKWGFWWTLDP